MKITERECFLSVEDDAPMAVAVFTDAGMNIIPIEDFLSHSKIDMSPDLSKRYAKVFRKFANELEEIGDDSPTH